jgi:hypothetical protein
MLGVRGCLTSHHAGHDAVLGISPVQPSSTTSSSHHHHSTHHAGQIKPSCHVIFFTKSISWSFSCATLHFIPHMLSIFTSKENASSFINLSGGISSFSSGDIATSSK